MLKKQSIDKLSAKDKQVVKNADIKENINKKAVKNK